jgi:cardiolipin synthase
MRKVNLTELRGLIKSGARVLEYPGMTHLKATICDGWATFGSANYDALSMRINRELNVATSDEATIQDLIRKVFAPDFKVSTPLGLEALQTRGGPVTELLGDQM